MKSPRNRIKPAPPRIIEKLEEANHALREIGELRRLLRERENTLCLRLQQIRQESELDAAPLRERLRSLETALTAFARSQRDKIFAKRRGLTLASGAFGFRKSSEIRPAPHSSWDEVLTRIQTLGLQDALRQRHEINKEHLRDWTEERLALIGARRVTKEGFWYEIREELLSASPAPPSP